jgi:hypothetical protein
MPESRGKHLHRKLGMTRRDLLRRGAIVGGTLIWTVPVIQSISRDSSAHVAPGSPRFFCCWCKRKPGVPKASQCVNQSQNPTPSASACAAACREMGFRSSHFHAGPNPIACNNQTGCAAH